MCLTDIDCHYSVASIVAWLDTVEMILGHIRVHVIKAISLRNSICDLRICLMPLVAPSELPSYQWLSKP